MKLIKNTVLFLISGIYCWW